MRLAASVRRRSTIELGAHKYIVDNEIETVAVERKLLEQPVSKLYVVISKAGGHLLAAFLNYPDTDDTSLAVLALEQIDMGKAEGRKRRVIRDALQWLVYMQSDDGGWAAFPKNQARPIRRPRM